MRRDFVGQQGIHRLRQVRAQAPGGFKHLDIERQVGGFIGGVFKVQHVEVP